MPAKTSNGFPRSKLYLRTIELLQTRSVKLTYPVIGAAIGVPGHWIQSLLKHPHMSPSVDRIERLYEYLSKKSLIVP